jgi:hypothetical protein
VNGRYVVDENGERVAVLLDIDEYEQMAAHQSDEPPDDDEVCDPEEAEHRITEFITSAGELPGHSVTELAEDVAKLMLAAWRDAETIMSGNPHNKILAAQLLLSQRALSLQADDPERWRLQAASTLLSGMVIRNVEKRG